MVYMWLTTLGGVTQTELRLGANTPGGSLPRAVMHCVVLSPQYTAIRAVSTGLRPVLDEHLNTALRAV